MSTIFKNFPGAPDPDTGSGKRNVGLFRSHTNANKERVSRKFEMIIYHESRKSDEIFQFYEKLQMCL